MFGGDNASENGWSRGWDPVLKIPTGIRTDRVYGTFSSTTWATCPKRTGVRGTLHPHRRTLRAQVVGHHVKPVFSEWERIFANPMATTAAIDRVVHHSVILEFDVPNYRTNAAQQWGLAEEVNRQN